ncbi:hypothetical protein VOLCADRAFT_108387 [Volvox carteri f. nagariensis]|uniref:Sulfhydryl oxidase n=1 Tax=Volvox carteri f. nagariensis TaxID=3068 RepID=D8UJW1_VOLCA|nr:uncharacterized protein VOLCADRAFT_108387 [Volvox carteri f. nagariensis]EFJ39979.1 hypothetical protein VOLCADRAFT_108387 [Volvox carteri f. nagariensis]|eukprot:XP_002958944.1 hypothetical protein VOLCADRAFT_108387 [Volvox carteri f. nagariensis]
MTVTITVKVKVSAQSQSLQLPTSRPKAHEDLLGEGGPRVNEPPRARALPGRCLHPFVVIARLDPGDPGGQTPEPDVKKPGPRHQLGLLAAIKRGPITSSAHVVKRATPSSPDTLRALKRLAVLAYSHIADSQAFGTLLFQAFTVCVSADTNFFLDLAGVLGLSTPGELVKLGVTAYHLPGPAAKQQGLAVVRAALSNPEAALVRISPALLPKFTALLATERSQLGEFVALAQQIAEGSAARGSPVHAALLNPHASLVDPLIEDSSVQASDSLLTMASEGTGSAAVQNVLEGYHGSLAALMQEFGYAVSADEACFKALLRQVPEPPSEEVVAEILLMMARTHTGLKESEPGLHFSLWVTLNLGNPPPRSVTVTTWNWPLVVDCLKSHPPGQPSRLNWAKVAECLDCERALLPDAAAFTLLASAFRRGAGEQLPVAALTRMWKHPACQLSFLKAASVAPPDVFSFESSKRLVTLLEGMDVAALSPNRAWASVDLLQALCMLMESAGLVGPARDVLQFPAATCPDLLLITIAETRTDWNLLQRDVFAALLPQHVALAAASTGAVNGKRSRELLTRVWSAAPPTVLLDLLIELYAQDPAHMTSRIAKVCADLGVLPQVLANTPIAFALELAAFAGGAGMINLEAWLSDYCNRDSMTAIPSMLRYVVDKTSDPPGGTTVGGAPGVPGASADVRRGVPLNADAARAFLKVLQASAQGLPVEMLRELQAVQSNLAKQFPSLTAHITTLSTSDTFASDVEEEANSYFQAIYNEARPIEEIIVRMQAYKSSLNPREQEVFACMIHNLFDEYRFFSRYPDRELFITATLFGSLIKHGLVSSITLGMALRYVLDALRKPAPSKMFTFGIEALRQFVHMIAPWPQFCAALLSNPQLREADAELYARVEQAQQAGGVTGNGTLPGLPPVGAGGAPQGGSASAVDQPRQQQVPGQPQQHSHMGALEANTHGSSRFLNLQPADNTARAAAGQEDEASVAAAGPSITRNAKDAVASARATVGAATGGGEPSMSNAAPAGGKGGARELNAGGGGLASVPAASGGQAPQPSNTSLSGEGEGAGMYLAAQVAAASLSAPMGPSLAALVNTESLESAAEKYRDFKEPPEAVADKVHFVMNNITKDNMESRSVEIRDRVWPDYLAWFANYMVVKRAAQEANFHTLYVSLLDHLNDRELYRLMVKTTMYYVKVLLYSERILKESNDRALLKNLGTWLGLLTFARNKPVLSRDLELKQVICEAYQRGRLIAVLPFVQKLLEGCRHSRVFKPTNPMVAAILSLLAELHAMKVIGLHGVPGSATGPCRCQPGFGCIARSLRNGAGGCWSCTYRRVGGGIQFSCAARFTCAICTPNNHDRICLRQGLKMNNAFSIELIFKAFGLSPHDVKPADTLKTLPRERITNPDWQLEQLPTEMPPQPVSDGPTSSAPATVSTSVGKPSVPSSPAPPSAPPSTAPPSSPGPMSGTGLRSSSGVQLPPGATSAGGPGSIDTVPKVMPAPPQVPAVPEQLQPQQPQQSMAYGMPGAAMPPGVTAPAAAVAAAAAAARAPGMAGAPGLPPDAGLFANLHQHVIINPSLGDIGERLLLKRHVPAAVDRAIGEIITPVVERSVTIACYTTYELVLKDFAGDGDENKLRKAAHLMVSSLAGSLSLVTAKDPLRISLTNQLRQMLQPQVADAAMLDQIISVLVTDNLDLGCNLIERAATDKAVRDIDKSLQAAYEERAKARAAGKQWVDAAAFHGAGSRFPGSLPESLRPRPGGINLQHIRVYEDFTRIPRTPPIPTSPALAVGSNQALVAPGPGAPPPPPGVSPRPPGAYAVAGAPPGSFQAVDAAVAGKDANPTADHSDLQALLAELSEALTSGAAPPEDAAVFFARRILKHLYDSVAAASGSKLSVSFHGACLELLNNMVPGGRVVNELTMAYLSADDERKFNPALMEMLLRLRFLNMLELDAYLSKLLQTPVSRTQAVSDLVYFLLRAMTLRDGGVVVFTDLPLTMELLGRMAAANPPLASLVEAARKAAVAPVLSRSPAEIPGAVREKAADPPGLRDQSLKLFEDWVHLLNMHAEDKALHGFLNGQVRAAGVLKMDDTTDRFLRTLTELAVAHCLASAEAAAAAAAAGAGARPEAVGSANSADGVNAATPPPAADQASQLRYLRACGVALHALQPLSVPGFAFGWLELISHRSFMPRVLTAPLASGWPLFASLLIALLRFLEPYLRAADLSESIKQLYKGCLRLLLVLLHDFPEFLCEHHFSLCEAIPPPAVQMRNLVLSAFPRNMRLPDPFTPNLKVDLLPEIQQLPRIVPDPEQLLPEALRQQELAKRCMMMPGSADKIGSPGGPGALLGGSSSGLTYNVPLINALVLYIGSQAKTVSSPLHPGAQEMYVRMAGELDAEGRYLLLNAMANQLRYPNAHTYYFSCTLLTLFLESKSEGLKEQITRTLLERLIVNRPHPWGLLITFIELIKNRRYNFWAHSFTKCAPEIENLFTSVSRSCLGTNRAEEEAAAAAHGKEAVAILGPEASTTASLPRAELPLPNHQSIGGPDVHMRTTNEPSGNSPASAPAAASDQPPARISLKDCRSRACAGVVDSFKRALRPRGEVALEGPARDPGSAGLAAFAAQTAAATDRQDEALAAAAAAAGGADAAGGCPPDTWQLGRATWTFLHSMAAAYPEQPSPRQQELMRYMMEGLAEFYPCEVCAEHLREQVRRRPPRVASAKDLNMWLCGIHNEVNEMLGKPLFDCNLLMERWRDGPPDGSCD